MAPKKEMEEMMEIEIPEKDDKWQAEGDLRILMDAEEIKNDKERLAAALAVGKGKKKVITSIEQLQKVSQEKFGS